MKNLLRLHEAIAIVRLKFPNRTASFEQIANEIENRMLTARLAFRFLSRWN